MTNIVTLVGLFGVFLLVGFAVWFIISVYNDLVSLHKRVKQTEQNIDVLLQKRQDELQKLIDAADTYMDHEEELMTELTEAREQAERAATPSEKASADQSVRQALSSFRARAEQYPNLRSQGNVLQVQDRISDIEDQLAKRREFFNESVTQYNTKIEQFPYLLIAPYFGYGNIELFVADEDAKEDVDVAASFS